MPSKGAEEAEAFPGTTAPSNVPRTTTAARHKNSIFRYIMLRFVSFCFVSFCHTVIHAEERGVGSGNKKELKYCYILHTSKNTKHIVRQRVKIEHTNT